MSVAFCYYVMKCVIINVPQLPFLTHKNTRILLKDTSCHSSLSFYAEKIRNL